MGAPGLVLLAALASAASSVAPPPAAPAGVLIQGLTGPALRLTAADLAALPQVHVTLSHGGRSFDYAGPRLADLLQRVDAPLGPRLHGQTVATIVRVEAADGYRVALSLGEVDPELRPTASVILADSVDGHPLPADEAPARLVIAGDSRPARDAREVAAITLQRLP